MNTTTKHLSILLFARIFSSMTTGVMYSTLALYLINAIHMPLKLSDEMIGIFFAFTYSLPIIGGFIANHWVSFKKLYVMGFAFQTVGILSLAYLTQHWVSIGLAMYLMGGMVATVSTVVFIAELAGDEPDIKRRAMLWNYSGMNVGFLLGFIFAGLFAVEFSYHAMFLVLSLSPLMAMLLIGILFNYDKSPLKPIKYQIPFLFLVMAMLSSIIAFVLKYSALDDAYINWFAFLCFASLLTYAFAKSHKQDRPKLFLLIFFMLVSIAFWTFYLLTPITLIEFLKTRVDLTIGAFTIAPQWIMDIDPLILILGTALLAKMNKVLKMKWNYSMSTFLLYFVGMSFVMFAMAVMGLSLLHVTSHLKLPLIFMMAYIAMLAMGEVFVGPEGYTLPSKYAPRKIQATMTGLWISTLGMASLLASKISQIYLSHPANYSHAFLSFTMVLAIVLLVIVILRLCYRNKH